MTPSAATSLAPLFLVALVPLSAHRVRPEPVDDPPAAADAAPAMSLQLSLADALRVALDNNIGLELAEIGEETARFTALGSWGAFDPLFSVTGSSSDAEFEGSSSLAGASVVKVNNQDLSTSLVVPFRTGGSFNFSYSRNNQKTNSAFAAFDVSTTDTVAVELTQPLMRGAWSRFATTAQREAEIEHRRQSQLVREQRQQLLLDVHNAYWDLVSAGEQVRVRRLALSLGRAQLERDERRLEVGVGTEVDVLQSQTNVAQQEEQLILAQFAQAAAEDGLRTLLFQRPGGGAREALDEWNLPVEALTPLPSAESILGVRPELDWMRSLDVALQERALLWQRRLEIESAEVALERARSDRRSQLDLTLSASGSGFGEKPTEAFEDAIWFDFPTTSAALTYSIPLLNRTARYAERSSRANVRRAKLSYDAAELQVVTDVRAAVRGLLQSVETLAAAKKSLELARRQLEAEEARHAEGLSTTFQVLEFQQVLAEALSSESAARAGHAKAEAALRHAEGRITSTGRADDAEE
jgi:HAE1 family hydrophobic/amphiphilic exporter-1